MKIILFLLILFLLLPACSSGKNLYTATILDKPVVCKKAMLQNCGINLYECEDGREYYCVQNVAEVSTK